MLELVSWHSPLALGTYANASKTRPSLRSLSGNGTVKFLKSLKFLSKEHLEVDPLGIEQDYRVTD
jgi:hypothetical protein